MSNYPHRGSSNGRGTHTRGRGSSSRGGRGRGGRPSASGPRLPSLLSDELGFQRRPKPFQDDDRSTRGRGGFSTAPSRGGPSHRNGQTSRGETYEGKKRKRPSPPPQSESEEEQQAAAPKKKKTIIEKGSGFRTKVSSDAQTPLARMLAAQGGNADDSAEDEQPEEPIKKRKMSKKSLTTDDVVDISIMGGAFSGGKKTQAELDEDAEIAWLEYQLRKGKGTGKGADEDDLDDGLDGAFSFGNRCVWY
jgi:hypothetical protein